MAAGVADRLWEVADIVRVGSRRTKGREAWPL